MRKVAVVAIILTSLPAAWGATYYLDATATGANDGTSWADACNDVSTMDSVLDALGDEGAGDTLEVNDGDYGAWVGGVLAKPRSDWLTIKAATGKDPNFTRIQADLSGAGSFYLHLEGLNIENDDPRPSGGGVGVYGDYGDEGWCLLFEHGNDVNVYDCTMTRARETASGCWSPYLMYKAHNSAFYDVDNLVLSGCEFHWGFHIIVLGNTVCDNVTITDCTIHGFVDNGILIAATDINVTGCTFYNNPDANEYDADNGPWWARGTITYANGGFVDGEGLTQASSGATGIYLSDEGEGAGQKMYYWWTSTTAFDAEGDIVGDTSGSTVELNYSGMEFDDAHTDAFQSDGVISNNVTLSNNKVWGEMETGFKVYGDGAGHTVNIENNLITNVHTGAYPTAMLIGQATGLVINNNICTVRVRLASGLDTEVDQMHNNIFSVFIQHDNSGGGVTWVKNHGNNIFGNDPDGDGTGDHPFDVNDASEEVDYTISSLWIGDGNYQHTPGGYAIDFGNSNHGPATDMLGASRDESYDAGPYEYIEGESPEAPRFIAKILGAQ